MGHLAQLWRTKKKTSTYFENLLVSFESVIDSTKKISSLVILITFVVFNTSSRVKKNLLTKLVDENYNYGEF